MSSAKALLTAHALRPKKRFGQNFMVDPNIAARIAALATTPPGGTVVEIGAGLGALTLCLGQRARHVIAVERDRDLVPLLSDALASLPTARVVEADAKKLDLPALFASLPGPHVVAGNLPYHLTGPLLENTVHARQHLDRAVYLVQLEVAERLAASAGTSAYGALSVFVQAGFAVRRAFVVRRGAFYPQPGVDSAVVVLEARREPVSEETPTFQALVRAAFAQRRKTLKNAWRGLLEREPDAIARAAEAAGIPLSARGETLDVEAFARMARELDR